jgi:hypothetical protein
MGQSTDNVLGFFSSSRRPLLNGGACHVRQANSIENWCSFDGWDMESIFAAKDLGARMHNVKHIQRSGDGAAF